MTPISIHGSIFKAKSMSDQKYETKFKIGAPSPTKKEKKIVLIICSILAEYGFEIWMFAAQSEENQ